MQKGDKVRFEGSKLTVEGTVEYCNREEDQFIVHDFYGKRVALRVPLKDKSGEPWDRKTDDGKLRFATIGPRGGILRGPFTLADGG